MQTLYYRFNSRRSKQPAGWRVIKIRSAIADRPGKYMNFTGFVSWHGSECTVSDASFILYYASGERRAHVAVIAGNWNGTLIMPEIAGGTFSGILVDYGEIYGGEFLSGRLDYTTVFAGDIGRDVIANHCMNGDKPDPWQPANAGEWVKWFNDDDLLAEWFKRI